MNTGSKITQNVTRWCKQRLLCTLSGSQEWARLCAAFSAGLLGFALLLLSASTSGPLHTVVADDMSSTNGVFIELVFLFSGVFFVGAIVFYALSAWLSVRRHGFSWRGSVQWDRLQAEHPRTVKGRSIFNKE
jgi:hypothetical protein